MRYRVVFATMVALMLWNLAASQTMVSGGIYDNTTWTLANSPYLMTGSIVVFPGVTLTIEPGVEVRVKEYGLSESQYYLETRGTINMVGQPAAPITFRADTALTTVGTWAGFIIKNSQGGSINYNYVNISNAVNCFVYDAGLPGLIQLNESTFSYNFYAIVVGLDLIAENCTFANNDIAIYGWSNFTFNNCVFDNNLSAMSVYASSFEMKNCIVSNNNLGVRLNSGALNGILVKNTLFENNLLAFDNANNGLIDSCNFIDNMEAVTNTTYLNISNSNFDNNTTALQVGFGTKVHDCQIVRNETGVALGPISFGQPMPVIENNRICFNQSYNIDNRTDINMFIPTNCFCITDSAEIEARILDGYDDITRGLISYAIFDTTCTIRQSVVDKSGATTSLKDSEALETVHVYPIPVTDQLTINNSNAFAAYRLVSLTGQEVMGGGLKEGINTVDVSYMPAGTYFLGLYGAGKESLFFTVMHN
ncbi:MAG: hypothetical protein IPL92_04375 [Saprospiraceae bacterium]|nr:hypothetical protein [Candidatus Opimibacter iunctus]